MSKGNQTETELLQFYFNFTPLPSYGANIYIHLHTADPGEGGDGSTNEVAYTGYAPKTVARDNSGFTVSGNQAVNAAEVTFGECSDVFPFEVIATHGSATTASGQILYSGALNAPLKISNLITPRFPAGTLVFTEE